MRTYDKRVVMEVNGMKCALNMPKAVEAEVDEHGKEKALPLPPYAPRFVFPVDEYPSAPANWMHGSGLASSYFVPVRPEHAMWLDFNYLYENEYDVACVVSIQGVNPITGQKTKELRLEQYATKCPVHDEDFKQDRFCEKCGYKWDAQNYMATTGTPNGYLWLDGFRAVDGIVRQYIFTEEVSRGVAAQIIGDDRVYAIGIAFYLSKDKKKKPEPMFSSASWGGYSAPRSCKSMSRGGMLYANSSSVSPSVHITDADLSFCQPAPPPPSGAGGFETNDASLQQLASGSANLDIFYPTQIGADGVEYGIENRLGAAKLEAMAQNPQLMGVPAVFDPNSFVPRQHLNRNSRQYAPIVETTHLEIGAGSRIGQQIHRDPQSLEYWQDKPVGMVYINYVSVDDAEKIISAGKRDMTAKGEGFLNPLTKGMAVG